MSVYKRGYRRYSGPLTGRWARFLVLPRYAWRRLYQQRLVLLLTILAFIWPLLCAGFIYLTNHAELVGFSVRARQAWTIARIELRRAFFAKRGLWVYALAFLPALIFFGHGLDAKWDIERLSRRGLTDPALMNSVQKGDAIEVVKARLGQPAEERGGTRVRRVRKSGGDNGATTHVIEPPVDARFVRLNISRPTYNGEAVARIYEFEIYGADGRENLARGRPATGSPPCSAEQGPERP